MQSAWVCDMYHHTQFILSFWIKSLSQKSCNQTEQLGQRLKIQEKCFQSWKKAFLQCLEYYRAQREK